MIKWAALQICNSICFGSSYSLLVCDWWGIKFLVINYKENSLLKSKSTNYDLESGSTGSLNFLRYGKVTLKNFFTVRRKICNSSEYWMIATKIATRQIWNLVGSESGVRIDLRLTTVSIWTLARTRNSGTLNSGRNRFILPMFTV